MRWSTLARGTGFIKWFITYNMPKYHENHDQLNYFFEARKIADVVLNRETYSIPRSDLKLLNSYHLISRVAWMYGFHLIFSIFKLTVLTLCKRLISAIWPLSWVIRQNFSRSLSLTKGKDLVDIYCRISCSFCSMHWCCSFEITKRPTEMLT